MSWGLRYTTYVDSTERIAESYYRTATEAYAAAENFLQCWSQVRLYWVFKSKRKVNAQFPPKTGSDK